MQTHGILITGTDTGVGKTFVACGVAAALRQRGLHVAPFKPAETGCELDAGTKKLMPADALLLQQASQTNAPLDTICPYRFRTPVAPAVAAELEGVTLGAQDVQDRLKDCYSSLESTHDVVIVETAGGILVPLAWGFHYGDLARLLRLPVLVVAGSKLGVLNHTLLTLEFLGKYGLDALGCVVNQSNVEQTPATETNVKALRKLLTVPIYALPYVSGPQPKREQSVFDDLASLVLERCR